jgi:hypothetical protein
MYVPAAGAAAPPSLNVDVPRLLLREYHHRAGRSRVRRQMELEQLLRRNDLPVGHTKVRRQVLWSPACFASVQAQAIAEETVQTAHELHNYPNRPALAALLWPVQRK